MEESCSGYPAIHVLLVEDEALIALMTAEALSDHGFVVHAAASGEAALRHLAGGAQVDILFTDINLGSGIGGEDLARFARELSPDLPVVYASGAAKGVERAVPGSVFLTKPYVLAQVCEMLARLAGAMPGAVITSAVIPGSHLRCAPE